MVSVVFSDLVGSTALQELLDAESVRHVMARFYAVMRGVVERHGGEVQKFIGDAVVAAFGADTVREDDALRAVRCAAEMGTELEALNDELEQRWGARLQMRTGVNTGELVISDEGILVGDMMNTAARLEQAAGTGHVLVGQVTRRLVHQQVELEEVAPLDLKGKAEPVRAWRLVSVESQAVAGIEAPLVGRDRELERLRAALVAAVDARACRLVSVIGSPGLGKSRLAAEFAHAVAADATVLEGHCEASGEGITFLPVAEVLRAAASIAEDDSSGRVVAKLTAVVPEGPDRDRVVARVAGLLGAGTPAAPEETFWGVRTVLEALARNQPLVVVLDDVHWGQPMFLDLIEHLVEWIRDAPVLLVALARPELRETREALAAAGRRPVDVLELEPLEPDQSRELVGGLLGQVDFPDQLLGRILETTEGNPLFLGELLRMLVDEGSLTRKDEVWVAVGGADAVEVPPTIHALLTARIERLRADERSVVERAAVIGKQFYRGAVAALVAPPIRSGIDGHLETLRRKDMVEPEGTYWIDEPVYRFHHVLIRDAAYHLLLKEARAELHEKFADWLETKAGELVGEHEEVIAYHLEQAHEYRRQLGPLDERGKVLGAQAASRLASAGRRALEREDLAAAANLLQRALDRDAGASEAEIGWDLGEALLSAGDTASAGAAMERFVGPRADVLRAQLAVLTGSGSLEQTLESVTRATEALAATNDAAAEAKGHHVTAQVQAQLGRVADVETSLDRALLAARRGDDRRRITAVLAAAPRAALWGPSPVVRASGRCLDVVRILRMTPGNRHVEAVALRCQAVLEAMRGRADAAREILAGGRATLEELGLTLELHELAMHAGIVELLAGQPAEASELLRIARDGFAALGVSVSAAQAAALLARALVEQGRDEDALDETEYAEQHAGGDLKTTITWLGARAEALARRREVDVALELANRAVALAEPTDALADKADANMSLARVLGEAGQSEEAHTAADAARALYEAKDHAVGVQWAGELASGAATRPAAGQPTGPVPTVDDPQLAAFAERYSRAWEERDAEALRARTSGDWVSVDCTRVEQFDHDDRDGMLARYRELGGSLDDVLGDSPPERWWAEFKRRFDEHDVDRMRELYHDDWTLTDHRQIGMDVTRGPSGAVALFRTGFEGAPDVRVHVDRVIARDERVVALEATYRGTAAADTGGGEFELRFVMVTVVEDGLARRTELFAPEHVIAIMARWRELHGLGLLGDLPPERLLATWIDCYARKDSEALLGIIDEDYTFIDRRSLAWEEQHGREQFLEVVRSAWTMWEGGRLAVDEVLSCDERTIAARCTYVGAAADGGGTMELPVGYVFRCSETAFRHVEQFEHDDADGMLARYAELGGTHSALGERPSERVMAKIQRVLNARDYDRMPDLVADDWYFIDHRALGWEEGRGREQCLAIMRSTFDASPDLRLEYDEVLAADDRVIVARIAWRGQGLKAGELEVEVGAVHLIEDGRWAGIDFYEPDDHGAMIARYVELGGGLGPLGARSPELVIAEFERRQNRQDLDAVMELMSPEAAFVDHRGLSWDESRTAEDIRRFFASAFETFPCFWSEVDEVLACDERVIAMRTTTRAPAWESAGRFEISFGAVVVCGAGLIVRWEQYEPDDREGMLARYRELGGRREPELGDGPAERLVAEYLRLMEARDLDALSEVLSDEIEVADHRPVAAPPGRGPDAALELTRSALEVTSELRFEIGEVLASGENAVALRGSWTGTASGGQGELTLPMALVVAIDEGKVTSLDLYEPDDTAGIEARFAEVSAESHGPARWLARHDEALASGELEAVVAPDVVARDRRGLPERDEHGIEAYRAMIGPDGRTELIGAEGDVLLARRGEDPSLLLVGEIHDGLLVQAIVTRAPQIADAWRKALSLAGENGEVLASFPGAFAFAADGGFEAVREEAGAIVEREQCPDRDTATSRTEELAGMAGWLAMARNFVDSINARDWDAFLSMYADEFVFADHRLMGWGDLVGPEQMVEALKGTIELAPSAIVELIELLDFELEKGMGVVRQFYTGTWEGGAYEVAWDSIMVIQDGLFTRGEVFGLEQIGELRARMEELRRENSDGGMAP